MLVILDNGHGVDTAGKCSPVWADGSQFREYEFNRDIVGRIAYKCKMHGIPFHVLVPEAKDISLRERVQRANAIYDSIADKCFLLSIHANAGMGTGFEVWTSKGKTKSDAYADIFMEEAERELKEFKMRKDYTDDDSDKEEQFYILRHTKCPAVLTENLFMDTERDCRFLMNEEGRDRIANFHYKAIKRIVETYGKG